jgi:chromosome segregation ATPase
MDSGDSDSGNLSRRRSDDSDTEAQLIAEQETQTLQLLTENLQKENTLLRAQFQQAVGIANEMEELHQKNQKLSSAVRSLEAEKSDLARRLEIALRANEELAVQLSDERQLNAQQQTEQAHAREHHIASLAQEFRAKTEALELRLRGAEEAAEKLELKNKTYVSRLHHLAHNASLYFGTKFADVDAVADFLARPPPPALPPAAAPPEPGPGGTEKLDRALSKLRKQRQVVRSARTEADALQGEVAKLQREMADVERRHQQELHAAEGKLAAAAEEYEGRAAEDARATQELGAQNAALRLEVAGLRKQLKEAKAQPAVPPRQLPLALPEVRKADPTRELREQIETSRQVIGELHEKVRAVEGRRDELAERLGKAERSAADLQTALAKEQQTLAGLQTVHKEALGEIATLRQSLAKKPDLRVQQT